jgi:hypothetical protein
MCFGVAPECPLGVVCILCIIVSLSSVLCSWVQFSAFTYCLSQPKSYFLLCSGCSLMHQFCWDNCVFSKPRSPDLQTFFRKAGRVTLTAVGFGAGQQAPFGPLPRTLVLEGSSALLTHLCSAFLYCKRQTTLETGTSCLPRQL